MAKKTDFKNLSEEELNKKLDELRMELIKLNAQVATGTTPKSPGQIRQIKKNIARIKTIFNQKKESGIKQ